MKNPELQLMIYGKDISSYEVKCNSNSVTIKDIIKTSNPNYLFIDIVIDESAQAGTLDFIFTKKAKHTKCHIFFKNANRCLQNDKGSTLLT